MNVFYFWSPAKKELYMLYRLSVKKLFEDFNPNERWVDISHPITLEMCNNCKDLAINHYEHPPCDGNYLDNTIYHVARVKYLIDNPDSTPIVYDAGCMGCLPAGLVDGHHRLMAAYFREDETIPIVFMGDLEMIDGIIEYYSL